jgi:pyruvate/2-oxoglutarate dehydrogenase complex dihydrolipoamide acyltransferase (E2) component
MVGCSVANSFGTETPPAPESSEGNALMSGAAPMAAAAQAAPQGAPGAQPQQAPAPPSPAETVAALRHFDAIKKELMVAAADPALGKKNIKQEIIDGMVRLVAQGMMKTEAAVDQLAKVPTDPLAQMKWVRTTLQQTQMAENGVLDHYGMTSPHLGTVADHFEATKDISPMDAHLGHMESLGANYGGGVAKRG